MKKVIQLMFLVNMMLVVILSGCTSVSTPVPSTRMVTPTAVYYEAPDHIASLDYRFTIAEVLLEDTVKQINKKGNTAHKGGLVVTANGAVPINATGDSVLILHVVLTSGDKQKFLNFAPRLIEDGKEKYLVEVITENDGNDFIWIYDVKKSSRLFALKLPNGSFDLKPVIGMKTAP